MKKKTSVVILIFNDEGKLALQLRAADDDSYAQHWDFSAAGGIEPEENHEHAAHRELYEELGVGGILEYIGEELYQDNLCTDKLFIYRTIHNGLFKPDKKEVEAVKFFTMDLIQDMLSKGEKFHPEFVFLWEKIKKMNPIVTSNLPKGISAPARRALLAAKYTNLKQFCHITESDLLKLHGMGPKAVAVIRQALTEAGLSFKNNF